mgnify:CR=1 FL=1
MKRKSKNLFKQNTEPQYNLRKLTVVLSLVVVVLGSVLVYRSIQAGQLQEAFFPSPNMTETVNKSLEEPKIEVTEDNSALTDEKKTDGANNKGKTNASSSENPAEGSDYFLNYAMERDSTRAMQVEMLTGLIQNANADHETKKAAQNKIIRITDALEDELLLTNLLNAKYDTETAVFVQDAQVNVIMKENADIALQEEVEKIAQIVASQTGVAYENVIIVLKK